MVLKFHVSLGAVLYLVEDKNQTDFQQLYRRGLKNNHLYTLENLLVSVTNLAPFQVTF